VTNQNSIQDEIKCRLEAGNLCYYSVQTLFCSGFLSKNLRIKIYILYRCKTLFLTLREERRLRVFENRILRRISGPKRNANREWRRLQKEELHSLYRLPNIVTMKSKRLRCSQKGRTF
jgi:hypothetical protein